MNFLEFLNFRYSMTLRIWPLICIIIPCPCIEMPAYDSYEMPIKVFSINSNPNFIQPWQNNQICEIDGSGCVIEENQILTSAHIVGNCQFLMVRKPGDPKKYTAKVIYVGYDCDLAILAVNEKSFFNDIVPVELGELPKIEDKIKIIGYPIGGDSVSITEGVISRIEPTRYSHSGRKLLAIQTDAAINQGNSGGAAIKDGKLIGIAFQAMQHANGIAYIIPVTIIRHFLDDIKRNGTFTGFPDLGLDIGYSKMENPAIRKWAKMRPDQSGVLITSLSQREVKKGLLKVNDVLMSIDDVNLANDSSIYFRKNETIEFMHLIQNKFIGDKCRMHVLRNGKEISLDYILEQCIPLVPPRNFDVLPSYYIIGGFVFVPLTQNYLDSWGDWMQKAPSSLVVPRLNNQPTEEKSQIVVLSEVLADEFSVGYQNYRYMPVVSINGRTIKDFVEFIKILETYNEQYLKIEIEGDYNSFNSVVIDVPEARKSTLNILKRYRIPSDRSEDIRLWTVPKLDSAK